MRLIKYINIEDAEHFIKEYKDTRTGRCKNFSDEAMEGIYYYIIDKQRDFIRELEIDEYDIYHFFHEIDKDNYLKDKERYDKEFNFLYNLENGKVLLKVKENYEKEQEKEM